MKEHPDIVKFCHFSAYVRTRSAGILRGLAPWHTDFGTKSSVLHLVRGVQAPGTHVRSDYPQTRHIGGRPSSHKANLIPQSKRQDTTVIVIPCLCSFNALCSPSAELPINKKRTQTLFHKESGSSTNCMVEHCPQHSNLNLFQILRQIPSTSQHTVNLHNLVFIVDAVEYQILVNDHPAISRVKAVDLAHFRGIA